MSIAADADDRLRPDGRPFLDDDDRPFLDDDNAAFAAELYALNALDPEDLDGVGIADADIDPVDETGDGAGLGGGVGGNSATHSSGCCTF